MRRAALLVVCVLVLAGCGGAHTTKPNNKGGRLVNKPSGSSASGIDLVFSGGSATLQSLGNKQTAVSLTLKKAATKGAAAELDKGSCGAPKGLQRILPLGAISGTKGSWSVMRSLTQLTASPLALVLRNKAGAVLACGQAHSG